MDESEKVIRCPVCRTTSWSLLYRARNGEWCGCDLCVKWYDGGDEIDLDD